MNRLPEPRVGSVMRLKDAPRFDWSKEARLLSETLGQLFRPSELSDGVDPVTGDIPVRVVKLTWHDMKDGKES